MIPGGRPRLIGFIFTVLLLGLIVLAVTEVGTAFPAVMVAIVLSAVGCMYLLFPRSGFVVISLANFLGVYACVYIFFVFANFQQVADWAVRSAFPFPVLTFLAGVWFRRRSLQYVVQAERVRDERHLGRTFIWLVPVFGIGALTFLVPTHISDPEIATVVFLAAMGAIALVVLVASRDITAFLLDSGLLFEEFFERAAGLLVPAFAFFTFYSLVVIVFGCIYRILDRFTEAPQFLVTGEPVPITFSQALYFSVITLSTVGYGDIVPLHDSVRVIVAIQIIVGVLLLLFGFSEIITYTRERRGDGSR